MRGHNPAWANLPRRKCDDCGNRKLKAEMQKMIAKGLQESAESVRRLAAPILDDIVRPIVREEIDRLIQQTSAIGASAEDIRQALSNPALLSNRSRRA